MNHRSLSVLITGGTGLIGQALIPVLTNQGCRISVLTRRPERYPANQSQPDLFSALDEIPRDYPIDAVINLAGAPIIGSRWTARRKQILKDSRIGLTRSIVAWMSHRQSPASVMISGSAVGYYGNRGNEILDESQPHGHDFSARLCRDWETECTALEAQNIRTATIRTGLVLSKTGGMLAPMLMSFRLGLGARIGDGNQWMSWIHIDDQVAAICHLLNNPSSRGAYNLTAPNPATNAEFSNTLARAMHRPRFLALPAPMLNIALGEASELLLGGQRAMPSRLLGEDFQFRFPTLQPSLIHILKI